MKTTKQSSLLLFTISLSLLGAASIQAGVAITQSASFTTAQTAGGIAISPDDSKLYVAIWEDQNGSRIQEYRLPDLAPLRTFTFGGYHTHGDVVLSADGSRLFTQNYYYGTVSMLSGLDGTLSRTDLSTVQSWPGEIDITPDRSKVLALVGRDGRDYNMFNDGIAIYDISGGNFVLTSFVPLADEPCSKKLAYSADSQFVYVPTRARGSVNPQLYEISLVGTPAVTRSMEVSTPLVWGYLWSLPGVACAGNTVFLSDSGNSVIWQVDRNTWTKTSVPMPSAPGTLMMHPDGKHLFAILPEAHAIIAVDITTMETVGRYDGLEDYATDIEFGFSGTKMYISHRNLTGTVMAFDVNISDPNPCSRIADLFAQLVESGLPDKDAHPLLVSLEAAGASCDRNNNTAAINQLEAFQNKVRAQVAKQNPALAEQWIEAAQKIIDQIKHNQPQPEVPMGKILNVMVGAGNGQIALFDTVTRQQTVIPGTLMQNVSTPNWSPDGTWLTFSGGAGFLSEIFKVHPDGSGLTALTTGGNAFVDPDWCPCGTKIAFQVAGGGNSTWVNADGTGRTALTTRLGFLRWSPDGSKLIGSNWGWESYNSTLSTFDLATSVRTVITPQQSGWAYQRSNWSPDGQQLAVGKQNRTTLLSDVVMMNADGSGEVNLTVDMPSSSEADPTWSPDGKWIFFMSNAAGNWDIWAMKPDGSRKLNLTQSPENEVGPPDFFPFPPSKNEATESAKPAALKRLSAPTGLRVRSAR